MGRFTQLQHHLGISPSRLSDNLKKMEKNDFVQHISPYKRRHPLLPEYQLTEKGQFLQKAAQVITKAEEQLNCGFLSAKAWNWSVLLALYHQYNRFNAIQKLLHDATSRALTMRLKELNDKNLIEKKIVMKPQPVFRYQLTSFTEPIVKRANDDLYSLLNSDTI